jgi:hypothetical protein
LPSGQHSATLASSSSSVVAKSLGRQLWEELGDEDEDVSGSSGVGEDDALHASRNHARQRSLASRGKLLWAWTLVYVAFCMPSVVDFIWDARGIDVACSLAFCCGLALFVVFCAINVGPFGETCCAPGKLSRHRRRGSTSAKRSSRDQQPLLAGQLREATFIHESCGTVPKQEGDKDNGDEPPPR